uniref:CCHC-type domain-containing protein n=1 Tax=Glossina pallidipes TaxID=7398 RepID=A0A1A9ZQV2_GLOPL
MPGSDTDLTSAHESMSLGEFGGSPSSSWAHSALLPNSTRGGGTSPPSNPTVGLMSSISLVVTMGFSTTIIKLRVAPNVGGDLLGGVPADGVEDVDCPCGYYYYFLAPRPREASGPFHTPRVNAPTTTDSGRNVSLRCGQPGHFAHECNSQRAPSCWAGGRPRVLTKNCCRQNTTHTSKSHPNRVAPRVIAFYEGDEPGDIFSDNASRRTGIDNSYRGWVAMHTVDDDFWTLDFGILMPRNNVPTS